jgi:hypothetical protein
VIVGGVVGNTVIVTDQDGHIVTPEMLKTKESEKSSDKTRSGAKESWSSSRNAPVARPNCASTPEGLFTDDESKNE